MLRLRASIVPTLLLLVPSACGSPEEAEPFPHERVCGEPGPKRLLDLPEGAEEHRLWRVGDRIVLVADESNDRVAHVVGECGEDPVSFEITGWPFVAGDQLFSHVEAGGELVHYDLDTLERHMLLTDVYRRVIVTPHGVLALSRGGGPLLLHPDPSDPSASPVTLLPSTANLDGAIPGEYANEIWSDGAHTFGLDYEGTVHRIDLATAVAEPIVTEASSFQVFDDGAQIVYDGPQGMVLRDLETGDELPNAIQGDLTSLAVAEEAHDWLAIGGVLVHLGRHEVLDPQAAAGIQVATIAPAEDGRVIVLAESDPYWGEGAEGSDYWLLDDDGSMERLVDQRCSYGILAIDSFLSDAIHPHGVMIRTGCLESNVDDDEAPFDVTFFSLDGEPYDLGRSFGPAWLVSDHLFSLELEWPYRLMVDSPDHEPRFVHSGVEVAWQYDEELFYVQGGLYRTVLAL